MDRSCKDEARGHIKVEKIKMIINREFEKELEIREKQLELVEQRIGHAQKTLQILRYVIVSNYYNNADKSKAQQGVTQTNEANSNTPAPLHPAVKRLLSGFSIERLSTNSKLKRRSIGKQENVVTSTHIPVTNTSPKAGISLETSQIKKEVCTSIDQPSTSAGLKSESYTTESPREGLTVRNRRKKDYVVVIGNISKWMPAESQEDKSTHKWMVYVRGPKLNPNISHFVQKVVFYLHPSYKPNDVIEIKEHPYHLSRRGWGEFPLRVRIYFVHALNKPVDILHQLKLDTTFTGRQTLGNETVVNLQLYTNETTTYKSETNIKEEKTNNFNNYTNHNDWHQVIKEESIEEQVNPIDLDHSYCSRTNISTLAEHVDQPENDLVHGLSNEYLCDTTRVTNVNVHKECSEIVVNNIPRQNKRALTESLVKLTINKKPRLYDCYADSSKVKIDIPIQRFKNALQVLPFIFKRLPIITKLAQNNTYKCTYPYVALNLVEYSSWNIGRRLSSEWFRAKIILNIVRANRFQGCEDWTTKKMIMYARAHGYSPLANYSIFKGHPGDYDYNYIPVGVAAQRSRPIAVQEEIVDILDIKTVSEKPEKYSKITQLIDLNQQKTGSFIRHAVLDAGFILKPEEIVPGVLFNATERVLLQAVLCLSEDLIRKAKANLVHEGNFNEDSSILTTDHILMALGSRSEFTLLLQPETG